MMRALSIAFGILFLATPGCREDEDPGPGGFAEHSSAGAHVLRDKDGRVLAVRGRFDASGGGSAEERAAAFVDSFRGALGLAAGVERGKASVSGTQIQTVTFPLTAGGRRIEGARLAVRLTAKEVLFVLISAPPSVPALPEPKLDAAAARKRASEIISGVAVLDEPELVVYAPELLKLGTKPPRLAWRVSMQPVLEGGAAAPALFVDAIDGSELGRLDRVRRARERQIYDIKSCVFSKDYPLCKELIYDESGVTPGATAWPEATTAWGFAADGCDFLQRGFSDDGPCTPLVVHLNSRDDHAAQLAGELYFGPGALSDSEGRRTFMHELGHALVDGRTERFTYLGQSGAVQEALADVVSMLATKPAKWVVDAGHPDERNISDPAAAKDNPGTVDELRAGHEDNGEVHYNSVVLSHAIWLATVEGLKVGDQSVPGMGVESMTSILDELLRGYLADYVTLRQAAAALIDACMIHPMFSDVFGVPAAGVSFRDCGLLVNALARVGLADPDSDLDGWPDDADNCAKYNPYQEDENDDGKGDACDESKPAPGRIRCPVGLTIQGAPYFLLSKHYDDNGAPKSGDGANSRNPNGIVTVVCQYYTSKTKPDYNHWVRLSIIFLDKNIQPPVVSTCDKLDTLSFVVSTQSATHFVGGTWIFQGVKKTDPDYPVFESAARTFLDGAWPLYEPFAAACP